MERDAPTPQLEGCISPQPLLAGDFRENQSGDVREVVGLGKRCRSSAERQPEGRVSGMTGHIGVVVGIHREIWLHCDAAQVRARLPGRHHGR